MTPKTVSHSPYTFDQHLDSLMLRSINKSTPRMQDAVVVPVLNISLLQLDFEMEFLGKEVQCIQSFSLSFGDRRDVSGAWQGAEVRV
jgi:hypothetical protein